MSIQRVAVLGAGVMGAAIAAQVANAGLEVLLLDLSGKEGDPDGRNGPATRGLRGAEKANPAAFMHRRNARRVTPGNFDDDMARLAEVDWVIEAVIERLDIKRALFERVAAAKGQSTIVSSNTSTIPLQALVEGMPSGFAERFLITHFFNPPRYMRLVELICGPETDPAVAVTIERVCDVQLGKGVVHALDRPGFIANRIGNYWLSVALSEAIRTGIRVEDADAVLGRPFGIPKTGVFGLLDLVGLDLMPHIYASMSVLLDPSDEFHALGTPPEFLLAHIKAGFTGRKGKGGFYRLNREGGARTKEALDLATGQFRASERGKPRCLDAYKAGGLRALVVHEDPVAQYAWEVMSRTLLYAVAHAEEIAGDVTSVDEAMKLGYRWEKGPFELIDELGADWFAEQLRARGEAVPALLAGAAANGFYRQKSGEVHALRLDHTFERLRRADGSVHFGDLKRAQKPLYRNRSSSLWDVGQGVVCVEFHTKMNALDQGVLEGLHAGLNLVSKGRTGLLVYNEAENFSVGANAGLILLAANLAMWSDIEVGLKAGQDTYQALKYAPVPVVGAPAGRALGGGCEVLLHCDAVQAHAETYMGLVEVGVGLIPGWGGCKEMICRWMGNRLRPGGPMPALQKAFELISLATVSRSAEEGRDHLFLLPRDRITMNRDRLLADARDRVVELADGYRPPEPSNVRLPGPTAKAALALAVDSFRARGIATAHDAVVADGLATVISGGATDITEELSETDLLTLEREVFIELLHTAGSAARLEHMLTTGKPLRN